MTKRLYYTDPIKALYMMRKFDVKLEWKGGSHRFHSFDMFGLILPDDIGEFFTELSNTDKIYVAKESESIFEPIKGDEGRWSGKRGAHYANYNGEQWVSAGSEEVPPKIIMRDNKHFFNPEIENND